MTIEFLTEANQLIGKTVSQVASTGGSSERLVLFFTDGTAAVIGVSLGYDRGDYEVVVVEGDSLDDYAKAQAGIITKDEHARRQQERKEKERQQAEEEERRTYERLWRKYGQV